MIVFHLKAAVEGVLCSVRNFSCNRIETIGNVQKFTFKVILKTASCLHLKILLREDKVKNSLKTS